MAKNKVPEEISAGAAPYVLTDPQANPNKGGDGSGVHTHGYGSVKAKQGIANANMAADAVELLVKAALEKEKTELKVTSK
jgi:hypothetical protein